MSRSDHSKSQEEIHKGFFQTSLRTFYNILHVKHEERGFLFFSMGKGREEMWSHFLMTRETGAESTLGMPRKGDQCAGMKVRRGRDLHKREHQD